jgi:hypothetical protein
LLIDMIAVVAQGNILDSPTLHSLTLGKQKVPHCNHPIEAKLQQLGSENTARSILTQHEMPASMVLKQ